MSVILSFIDGAPQVVGEPATWIALLDGHRHAVQRTEALAFFQRGVGGLSRACALSRVSVQMMALSFGLYFSIRAEEVVEQFERTHAFAADERSKLGRGLVVQLIHFRDS
jgi:hypothetical protein